MKIAVLGSISMDLIARVPRLPNRGETILADHFTQSPGGKGANQAVACARLGAQVAIIGRVGGDDFGQALLQSLRESGVETRFVTEDTSAATGVALIGVDVKTGDNAIIVALGTNGQVSESDIDAAHGAIAAADILICSLEVPPAAIEAAARLAAASGVRVLLNPAPAPERPLPDKLMSHVAILTPNEHEAALLTGGVEPAESSSALAMRLLRQTEVQSVVVTLGAEGSLAVEKSAPEQVTRMPAHRAGPTIDTIGAGDCYTAALAVALAEGNSLRNAMSFASTAAGCSVTRDGAQSLMPTREEVETALRTGEFSS